MAARNSRETSVTITRGKYDGVLSILQYNWHFYAASLCALVGIGALLRFRLLPHAGEELLIGAATLTAFWSLSSLLVSYYVYDYRGVTRWNWIPQNTVVSAATVAQHPRRIGRVDAHSEAVLPEHSIYGGRYL